MNFITPIIFRKEKLVGDWKKSRQVEGSAKLVLYNVVNAFKFPDKAQVHITCNVEVRLLIMIIRKGLDYEKDKSRY